MPSSDPRPAWWRLAGIPLLVFLVSPLFAEVGYRWSGVTVGGSVQGVTEWVDGRPAWNRPNAEVLQTWTSGNFWVRTDSLGFRARQAGPGTATPDILVLGDSQTFGQGVDYEGSVVGAFAALAEREGLSVVNAGIGGHWLRDQAAIGRWLASEGGVQPRVVLACLTPRSIAKPDAGGEYEHKAPPKPSLFSTGKGWLSRHSAVYLVVRDALRDAREAERPWRQLAGMYSLTGNEDALALKISGRLQDMATAFGTTRPRLVVCYLPLEAGLRLPELAERHGLGATSVDVEVPLARAIRAAALQEVPLVDLTDVLHARELRDEAITLDGDPHYNSATSRECAQALWRAVDWVAFCKRGD